MRLSHFHDHFLHFFSTASFGGADSEPLSEQATKDAFFVQQCITYWMVIDDIKNLQWALDNGLSPNFFLVPPLTTPSQQLVAFTTAHLEEALIRYKRLPVPPYIPPVTYKQTLLHYAITCFYEKAINLLLSYGASPLLKHSYGNSAFDATSSLPTPYYEKVLTLFKKYNWHQAFVEYLFEAHKILHNRIYG